MELPQMMGVDQVRSGIANFQVMFSLEFHRDKRFFSPLAPLRFGPLHCGQFSQKNTLNLSTRMINRKKSPFFTESLLVFLEAGFVRQTGRAGRFALRTLHNGHRSKSYIFRRSQRDRPTFSP